MNPRMNTSLRSRGKWGDFVVAIIPASWCVNILTNSNFILRMIEWQSESSLFTVRIHGKQWYWVYKYDLKNVADVFSAPKSMGAGRWFVQTPSDLSVTNNYLQSVQISSYTFWLDNYWKLIGDMDIEDYHALDLSSNLDYSYVSSDSRQPDVSFLSENNNLSNKQTYEYLLIDDEWDISKDIKHKTYPGPLRITKHMISTVNSSVEGVVNLKWSDDNESFELKLPHTALDEFYIIRQKRLNKKQGIKNSRQYWLDEKGTNIPFVEGGIKYQGRRVLMNNKIFENVLPDDMFNSESIANDSAQQFYRAVRFARKRANHLPVTLSRRLLRTKRTLVLPAHVNLSLVTNSYDVVHSWFIPGLGIKMDCVPGRSTHHSLYIDYVGFYYGQCAEICGRYHHHMPIRVCALPFEHFLVWWSNRGMPYILKLDYSERVATALKRPQITPMPQKVDFSTKKYVW